MPDPLEVVGFWVAGETFCPECATDTKRETGQLIHKIDGGWEALECVICGLPLIEALPKPPSVDRA